MKAPVSRKWFLFFSAVSLAYFCSAQCPTVNNTSQSFCDLESLRVSNLQANDTGAGIAWFNSPSATTPLAGNASLINGATYYLDNAAGNCGNRIAVSVSILGPPTGLSFQGVCVEDPAEATLADLEVNGNNINWYASSSSNTPLALTTNIVDDNIYYANQENPATGCRTSRLAVRVNIGIVPVPTGESFQQFCIGLGLVPTIADLEASGNNFWYSSIFSASPLDPSTALVDGEFYYATISDPPCESINRFEVQVSLVNQISAGTDGSLEICNDISETFDLFQSLGGNPEQGGTWSPVLNSGTGIFDPSIDPEGTYTYTVSNADTQCPEDSATVTVTFRNPPIAGENGSITICSDNNNTFDLFDSLGGTPDTGGTWSPPLNSGTGIFDPSIDAEGTFIYTVTSPNMACSDAAATVTVNFLNPPQAGNDGSLEICLDDTSTIDLFDSLGGTPDVGGTWSPALNSGTGIFDPSLDAEGVYTYTVESSNDICSDDSATVTVSFLNPPQAGADGSITICSDDTDSFDLFDSLGGTPDVGGTWSPALNSGTGIFDPSIDTEGIYTYTVESSNNICADDSATVTVSFLNPPQAGTDGSITICFDDTDSFDLFDSLGGTPDVGGTWSPALNSGTGIFDPSLDAEGVYTYTVESSNDICSDDSATVTVSFLDSPQAGTDGSITICSDDTNSFDLFDSLGGTPDVGGTWSPALNSGTGIFDPSIDTEGIYTYTVESSNNICADDSATVTVSFLNPPQAGTDGSITICSDDIDSFDLLDSLGGTPDVGGTWSPALNSGTGIFDPSIDAEGVYTYTVESSNDICSDASASVTVSFLDPPQAGTDGSLTICSDDTNSFDLFDSLGGTPDTGGTWSPALNSGTGIFDPTIDAEGIYTYTVESSNNICADDSATVTVGFLNPPQAGTDGSITICSDDTDSFDLFDSLGGTPDVGGTWSPALNSGTGIFDPTIDPEGIYTYTVASSNDICSDASASVTVSFLDPPQAGTDGSLTICSDDTNSFDLFDSLGGTPDTGGTWSPALNSGTGIFDPTIDAEGTYTYTVESSNNICTDDSATVTVSFLNPPQAGTDGSITICSDDTDSFDLFDSLGGTPDVGGTWSPALNSGTGIFDPSIDAEGIYTYNVESSNEACSNAAATVTVIILNPPQAGADGSLTICSNDSNSFDLFDSLVGTPDTGGTWSPALNSGSGIFDPSIDEEGIYTYTVPSNQCGSQDSAEVTVTIIPSPTISNLIIKINDVCQGFNVSVSLEGLNNLENGDYIISYVISGNNSVTGSVTITSAGEAITFILDSNLFPFAGFHTFNIVSVQAVSTGCFATLDSDFSENFQILESPSPEIIAGGNIFCEDEASTLEDLTVRIVDSNGIEWYDSETSLNPLPSNTVLVNGVTYFASIINSNGCRSFSRLQVEITLDDCIEDLIIPDGFSPNGDSVNDTFHIVNLDVLYPNFNLTIYNRYGNKLYEGNINTPRWDGTTTTNRIGNSIVPTGVYFFVLEFNDGIRKAIQGRVYLSR